VINVRKPSDTYSSDFEYLATSVPGPLPNVNLNSAYQTYLQETASSAVASDHKLRKYVARTLTQAIAKDLQYLSEEIQFLRFRYIDQEVQDIFHNFDIAIGHSQTQDLEGDRLKFHKATQTLHGHIDEAVKRAEEIIVWRVEREIESLIKKLT
jgi:hypothetical protein